MMAGRCRNMEAVRRKKVVQSLHIAIEEQSIEYCGSEIATHHVTKHNTPIYNIVSTAPQLRISQKALGTILEMAM
jgi:hypothetical protein